MTEVEQVMGRVSGGKRDDASLQNFEEFKIIL